jgi:hypothetical protein
MLFVIAMEGLSRLIKVADDAGLFQQLGYHGITDQAFFYADDDVVLFIKAREQDLVLTNTIIQVFGNAWSSYQSSKMPDQSDTMRPGGVGHVAAVLPREAATFPLQIFGGPPFYSQTQEGLAAPH